MARSGHSTNASSPPDAATAVCIHGIEERIERGDLLLELVEVLPKAEPPAKSAATGSRKRARVREPTHEEQIAAAEAEEGRLRRRQGRWRRPSRRGGTLQRLPRQCHHLRQSLLLLMPLRVASS